MHWPYGVGKAKVYIFIFQFILDDYLKSACNTYMRSADSGSSRLALACSYAPQIPAQVYMFEDKNVKISSNKRPLLVS